jgi:hypothetical protein
MPRQPVPLTIPDISAFAKALRGGLTNPPSHVETLSLVARAAGYRNFQHLRASLEPPDQAPVDKRLLTRACSNFDGQGRLTRWPGRHHVQRLCLWVVWAAIPSRRTMTERDISQQIDRLCSFRDAAQIRRAMIEHKMLTRNLDGSEYRRVEQVPPREARALFDLVFRAASLPEAAPD